LFVRLRGDKERDIQFQLNRLNTLRFNPRLPSPTWKDDISELARLSILEGRFLEAARKVIAYRAASAPANANQFLDWFEELKKSGPGQNDPLFLWLAEECSMEQMKRFLTQEVAGEAGFEDLTALTQLKLPISPNLSWPETIGTKWDAGIRRPYMVRFDLLVCPAVKVRQCPSRKTRPARPPRYC
jgi:hypothetical protein